MIEGGSMNLQASCVAVEITPKIGTPIGGNVRSDHRSRGVHDPLFANLLFLRNGDERLLFIGLDVIGVHRTFVQRLKKKIHSHVGLEEREIAIFATHTHSGPDLIEAFKNEYDPLILAFMDECETKLIKALTNCFEQCWNAKVAINAGTEEKLSFNRRLVMKDGAVRMNWEEVAVSTIVKTTGPIDPELIVLTVYDEAQTVRAILINFALHPAILVGKDWLFSRDFIHDLTYYLQQKFGDEVVVLFANGAEGNINHINIWNENKKRGFDETRRIGVALARNVESIVRSSRKLEKGRFTSFAKTIEMKRREISEKELLEARKLLERTKGHIPSLLDGVPDEVYAMELLTMNEEKKESIETEIQLFTIDDIAIVFLPGEFFVELGLQMKEQSPFPHTCIVGMANDYVGYVPNKEAFSEGGYEIKTARTSQLIPEAGAQFVAAVVEMLHEAKGVRAF